MTNCYRFKPHALVCAITTVLVWTNPIGAQPESPEVAQLEATTAERIELPSVLESGPPSVDPVASNDASAVITRPSLSRLLDAAVDFNNEEGTLSLKVIPALLVTTYPDWYVTGLAVTAASNTEEKNFSLGGKWDLNFRDPRFQYRWYKDDVLVAVRDRTLTKCKGLIDEALNDCAADVLDKTVDEVYLEKLRNSPPIALSIGGNATYDNNGNFGGGNATFAFDAATILTYLGRQDATTAADPARASGRYPVKLAAALNAKYEDAIPSDTEKEQLKKAKVTFDDDDRGQKAGGGLELSLAVGLGGENENERSIELGLGASALACLDGLCDKLDNGSSVKVNPFLAVAITKSIAGRVDVVWDGTGHKLGDAFAGASLKYSFSGPK